MRLAKKETAADLFFALGDGTRLHLLSRLSEKGPLSITELTLRSQVTRQAVTKHLKVLEQVHLITSTRRGRSQIWQLQEKRLKVAQDYLEKMSDRWNKALLKLEEFLAEND